jgi:hypothetical protein
MLDPRGESADELLSADELECLEALQCISHERADAFEEDDEDLADDPDHDWDQQGFAQYCDANVRVGPANAALTAAVKGLKADEIIEADGKTFKVVKRTASPDTDVSMASAGEDTATGFFQGAANEVVGQAATAGPQMQKQRATFNRTNSLKFQLMVFVTVCMAVEDVAVWGSFTNVNLKPRSRRKVTGFQDVDDFHDERFQNTTSDDAPGPAKKTKTVATNRWHADVFSTPFIDLRIVYALGDGDGAISFSYTPSSGGKKLTHTISIPSGHFLYAKRELLEGYR